MSSLPKLKNLFYISSSAPSIYMYSPSVIYHHDDLAILLKPDAAKVFLQRYKRMTITRRRIHPVWLIAVILDSVTLKITDVSPHILNPLQTLKSATCVWVYSNIYPSICNVTQFILSGNFSTRFGWYLHPSSGAQTTVSTASGICHTVIATCRSSTIAAGSNNGVTNNTCCRSHPQGSEEPWGWDR